MAGKKSSGLGPLLIVLGGIAAGLAQYDKEILILGGIALAVWITYKIGSSGNRVGDSGAF